MEFQSILTETRGTMGKYVAHISENLNSEGLVCLQLVYVNERHKHNNVVYDISKTNVVFSLLCAICTIFDPKIK